MQRIFHTPEGVRDIYNGECSQKHHLQTEIRTVFDSYGYEEIETPSFEYFEVFSREVGTIPSKDLYKFFDREGNTLVLRPDFTPSVSRACATYFNPEQEVVSPLERYAELFAMNNDMAGWIRIEDTQINYPVMYTPDNPDYYLKHNFYKESSAYGVPYIAEHCDPMEPSDNVIIYGHHMNNGSMFAGLMNYEGRDFYEQHKIVHFDTLTETAEYEVIAVFKTTVYDDTGFKFYLFSHAETEKEFTDYVE